MAGLMSHFFGGGGGGGNFAVHPNNLGRAMPYVRALKAYSEIFMNTKTGGQHLKRGNKIIMPQQTLMEIARGKMDGQPLTFMISNPKFGKKTHVGVLEFSATDGLCYLPAWMMEYLLLQQGSQIFVRSMQLKKGTFIALQPHETAFVTQLSNPKAILQNELTHYACLTEGDKISINYNDRDYTISVVECRPDKQICIVNTDVELEFKEPLDYDQYSPPKLAKENSKLNLGENEMEKQALKQIEQKYKRLDGKQLTDKQKKVLMQKKIAQEKRLNQDFDPRKHRLPNGFPIKKKFDFSGAGTKLG